VPPAGIAQVAPCVSSQLSGATDTVLCNQLGRWTDGSVDAAVGYENAKAHASWIIRFSGTALGVRTILHNWLGAFGGPKQEHDRRQIVRETKREMEARREDKREDVGGMSMGAARDAM